MDERQQRENNEETMSRQEVMRGEYFEKREKGEEEIAEERRGSVRREGKEPVCR